MGIEQTILFYLGIVFIVIGLALLIVESVRSTMASGPLGGLIDFAEVIEKILARILPGKPRTYGVFLILVGLLLLGLSFYVSDHQSPEQT